MTIPSTLQYRYNAGSAVSPEQLAFGYDSTARYKAVQRRQASVMKAAGRFIRLGKDYYDSYRSQERPLVGHYRDYLISRAVCVMAENMQYPDATATGIILHADRVWRKYAHTQMWAYQSPKAGDYVINYRYAGQLGTLAYYFQFVETEGLYPMDAIEACLNQVWTLLGGGYGTNNVRNRHINFLARFVPDADTLNKIEVALAYLYEIPESHPNYRFRQILRRNLVGRTDVTRLKQRILMGEYINGLIDVAEDMLTLAQTDTDFALEFGLTGVAPGTLRNFENSVLSILKPGGMSLVYALFAAEAFLKAAQFITNMPDEIAEQSIYRFLDSTDNPEQKLPIANFFATATDAYTILAEFNTRLDAGAIADEMQAKTLSWLNSAGVTQIAAGSPSRLEGFYAAT